MKLINKIEIEGNVFNGLDIYDGDVFELTHKKSGRSIKMFSGMTSGLYMPQLTEVTHTLYVDNRLAETLEVIMSDLIEDLFNMLVEYSKITE